MTQLTADDETRIRYNSAHMDATYSAADVRKLLATIDELRGARACRDCDVECEAQRLRAQLARVREVVK